MGIFSAIGGAISSAVSSVCSAVSSFASSIGRGISAFSEKVLYPFIKFTFEEFEKTLEVICAVIDAIAEALGLKDEEEKPEEIGMKAEEAEKQGITPENFDSYEEYINHLRENIDIDKSKLENLSKEEKLKYMSVGSFILVKGIEEKENFEIPGEFVAEIGKQNLSAEEVKEYIRTFKTNDLQLKDFTTYLNGTLDNNKYAKVGNAIEEGIKSLNPDMSEDEIDQKIDEMRYNARK